MDSRRSFNRQRFIRFAIWCLAMLVTFCVVERYAPHRLSLVPIIFICLMVPAVLLPLRPSKA